MTLLAGQSVVSTSAVFIYRADGDGSVVTLHNDSNGNGHPVYLGPAGVTVSSGLYLPGDGPYVDVRLAAGESLYAIASNAVSVSWLAVHG
jgi:hypothetical protein